MGPHGTAAAYLLLLLFGKSISHDVIEATTTIREVRRDAILAAPNRVEIIPNSPCHGRMKCCMDGDCITRACSVNFHGSSSRDDENNDPETTVSLVFEEFDNTTAADLELLDWETTTTDDITFNNQTDHNVTVKCDTSNVDLVQPFTVRYYRYEKCY